MEEKNESSRWQKKKKEMPVSAKLGRGRRRRKRKRRDSLPCFFFPDTLDA